MVNAYLDEQEKPSETLINTLNYLGISLEKFINHIRIMLSIRLIK